MSTMPVSPKPQSAKPNSRRNSLKFLRLPSSKSSPPPSPQPDIQRVNFHVVSVKGLGAQSNKEKLCVAVEGRDVINCSTSHKEVRDEMSWEETTPTIALSLDSELTFNLRKPSTLLSIKSGSPVAKSAPYVLRKLIEMQGDDMKASIDLDLTSDGRKVATLRIVPRFFLSGLEVRSRLRASSATTPVRPWAEKVRTSLRGFEDQLVKYGNANRARPSPVLYYIDMALGLVNAIHKRAESLPDDSLNFTQIIGMIFETLTQAYQFFPAKDEQFNGSVERLREEELSHLLDLLIVTIRALRRVDGRLNFSHRGMAMMEVGDQDMTSKKEAGEYVSENGVIENNLIQHNNCIVLSVLHFQGKGEAPSHPDLSSRQTAAATEGKVIDLFPKLPALGATSVALPSEFYQPSVHHDSVIWSISTWAFSTSADRKRPYFTVFAPGGYGKTAIAGSLSLNLIELNYFAGYFSFEKGKDVDVLPASLAHQVGRIFPNLDGKIEPALTNKDLQQATLQTRLVEFVLKPLNDLKSQQPREKKMFAEDPCVIILDGLDQLKPDALERLLEALRSQIVLDTLASTPHVKFLLLSRPTAQVKDVLKDVSSFYDGTAVRVEGIDRRSPLLFRQRSGDRTPGSVTSSTLSLTTSSDS